MSAVAGNVSVLTTTADVTQSNVNPSNVNQSNDQTLSQSSDPQLNQSLHLPLELVDKCIGSNIHVLTKFNTEISGVLKGYDDFVNMIITDASEIEYLNDGTTRVNKIDSILLNGNQVTLVRF